MLDYAVRLRSEGKTIPEIVMSTKIPRTSLYRHLPRRPSGSLTAAGTQPVEREYTD
jgi:hypothetical protein